MIFHRPKSNMDRLLRSCRTALVVDNEFVFYERLSHLRFRDDQGLWDDVEPFFLISLFSIETLPWRVPLVRGFSLSTTPQIKSLIATHRLSTSRDICADFVCETEPRPRVAVESTIIT